MTAEDGPLLVLAGAGTGKTRVLTTRLAHILLTGRARPHEVLAVTFTNRAAREMAERVEGLIGRSVSGMWLGTFHAMGVRMIRAHAELVGLQPSFTILDSDDQERLAKQVIQAAELDERRWPARLLVGTIQRWKDRGYRPDQVPAAGGRRLRARPGRRALRRLPAAADDAERLRFRRPAAARPDAAHRPSRRAGPVPAALPRHPGRRVPGHQRRPVSLAAPARRRPQERHLRRRRRPVDLQLARGRGRQHPALRAGLPGRAGDPAGAQLPLDRPHPGRRVGRHRAQPGPPRQDAVDRGRAGRAGPHRRPVGRPGGGPLRRRRGRGLAAPGRQPQPGGGAGPRRLPDPRPSRSASSSWASPTGWSAARASTSGPRSATPSPISAWSASRTTIWRSSGSSTCRGAASATARCAACARPPAARRSACSRRRGPMCQTDELPARARNALLDLIATFDRWRGQLRRAPAARAGRDGARRIRLHRDVAGRAHAGRAGPAGEPEGAGQGGAGVRDAAGLPRACQPGDGERRPRPRPTWSAS